MRLTWLTFLLSLGCSNTQQIDFLPTTPTIIRGRTTPYELVSAQSGGGGCLISPLGETRADAAGRFELALRPPYDMKPVSLRAGKKWLHWEPYLRTDQAVESEGGLDSTGSLEVRVRVLGCEDAVAEALGEVSDSLDRILFLRDLPDDRSFTVRTSCRDADRYTSHRQLHRPGDDRNKLVRFARVLPLTLELRDPSGAAIPRLILIIDARSNDSSMMMALAFETDAEGRVSLEVPEDLHQLRFWSPNGGDVVARREWAGEPLLHLVHPVVTRAAELPR